MTANFPFLVSETSCSPCACLLPQVCCLQKFLCSHPPTSWVLFRAHLIGTSW
ncbi:hypothetical protein L208DRAFT_1399797 [Tricholoma matsutake]|nr:hypothetical protein L208DRAFT_1399797 [Tricholoma matsutake 945]